ncbi:MAG: glycosyltransferase family 4 protein [Patescibacteria group bacterium]|nr:glycosyltransferase family 4 protein [Patescibacteria group bacterium]
MNKKILIATGIYPPEIGGPATHSKKIAEILSDNLYDVCVVTYSDKNQYDFDGRLKYKLIRIARSNKIFNYINYFFALVKNVRNYDFIYAFDYFSTGLPAFLVCKLFRKKLVIRIGGDFLWEQYLDNSNGETLKDYYNLKHYKQSYIKFIIIKLILRNSDKIIFTTNFQKNIFQQFYKINKKNIIVIENPIFLDRYYIEESKLVKNKNIVFAGRMKNKNNLERLLKIFLEMGDIDFNLLLIGDGPIKNKLKDIIKNKKNIKIYDGVLGSDLLNNYFKNARAVILPSYTDISPNTALECISLGLPFIMTKEHGFDWMKNYILEFDPKDDNQIKDAINKIMDDRFCLEYIKIIRNINCEYDSHKFVEKNLQLFNNL